MSLRHASRVCLAYCNRAAQQGLKEKATKCDVASKINNGRQARRIAPSALDSVKNTKAVDEKRKRAEESLRTVMYLSCWGPN